MQKLTLIIALSFFFHNVYCQTEVDDRASSYILGKQYYIDKDYLNAYKYLLVYKFTKYDQLSMPQNSQVFVSLNKAIVYCESQIKKALSGGGWEGRGWSQSEVETAKETTKEKPPVLPNSHF